MLLEVFESSRGLYGGRLWVFELIPDFVISCHKDNQRLIIFNYIYRISYKNAKKANLEKGFTQIEKRYHTNFETLIFTFSLQNSQVRI
jgi:hypothetical protein